MTDASKFDETPEPVATENADDSNPQSLSQNQNSVDVEGEPRPLDELTTLDHVEGHGPTGHDGRPDGFVPSDQTAAGALTPDGAKHPGEPAGIPGIPGNLLDPYNVNGTQRNQELIAEGIGIENPDLDKGKHADEDDDK